MKINIASVLLKTKSLFSTLQLFLAYNYICAVLGEYCKYYYVYLLLNLPAYMFTRYNKEVYLKTDDGHKNIWIVSVKLVMETKKKSYETERISGTQLLVLSDEYGRITFNDLKTFFPNLYTLHIQYLDLNEMTLYPDSDSETYAGEGVTLGIVNRIIDIEKRIDIRSATKCKFGRIQI